MSDLATYTFLPWLRQGIANQISGQSGLRATIPVELLLSGDRVGDGVETRPPIRKDIEIYGPGDVTGLEAQAIIKVEPQNWLTNFEPNYVPFIEFYDEDLPWRYSPLTPVGHRLHPWIMLVVLREGEFTDGRNLKDRPLPYFLPTPEAKFPPVDQLWAWAHVHLNRNIIGGVFISDDANAIATETSNVLRADPDLGYSRIIAPRRLDASSSYHAFLVPVFETGRLAGLGQDPAGAAAFDALAWADDALPVEMPYYHRWFFRTGTIGDFEYLVRLLKPQPIDSRVGIRDLDVQKPGANIRGIVDADDATDDQRLGGILKLGGALRIPDIFYTPEEFAVVLKYRNWATLNGTQPYPHPFQRDLAAFINLADGYEVQSAAEANSNAAITEELSADDPDTEYDIGQNPDPLITAPLYARWHALTKRLLNTRAGAPVTPNDNWVHELNLDPRWRVAAGFGTRVIQENQEDYMKAAWDQVGAVLESNKKIKYGQMAREVSYAWYTGHLQSIKEKQPDKWLTLSAAMHKRILLDRVAVENGVETTRKATAFFAVNQSHLPQAALSTTMRKLMRPRGVLMKRLVFADAVRPDNIVSRINEGDVSAAPPRETPASLGDLAEIADGLETRGVPDFLVDLLRNAPWIRWIPVLLAILLFIILLLVGAGILAFALGALLAGALVYLYRLLSQWAGRVVGANSIREENLTPESIDSWPNSPDFRIVTAGDPFRPSLGGSDSPEGVRFKAALKDAYTVVRDSVRASVPVRKPPFAIVASGNVIFETLHPDRTVPNWVWGSVRIPGRIREQLQETFVEAMAYPEIDLPMYKPLVKYSSELFLPNINFIAQNSISLLETNQPFIESYMVGLNHEFGRELLWREFPTDQRPSTFLQFWEPRGFHNDENLDAEALKKKLRDIPPLHLWSKFSHLGDHDNREAEGENEEEVVLVIRGELLKKYPTAVIYAQRAVWRDADGEIILDPGAGQTIDPSKERDLRPLSPAEEANPPRTVLKSPLYEAKVDPDIYFFGFDLTACEAKGGTGKVDLPVDERCAEEGITWDDPGWFFVIKERPGEPRFGLDISEESSVDTQGRIEVWNDLSWRDITPAVAVGEHIRITAQTQTITANQPLEPDDPEKQDQHDEDGNIRWSKDMSSAELAYILYQVPTLVAVHASEMLPRDQGHG